MFCNFLLSTKIIKVNTKDVGISRRRMSWPGEGEGEGEGEGAAAPSYLTEIGQKNYNIMLLA